MLRTGPRERVGWHKKITMPTEAEIDGRTLKAGPNRLAVSLESNEVLFVKTVYLT